MAHIECDIYTIYDPIRYGTVRYDAMRCDNYMSISISGVHFDIELLLFHGSCCSARCCCYCCCYNSWLILFTNFVVPLLPIQFLLSLWPWLWLFICFSFCFFMLFSFTLFYVFVFSFVFVFLFVFSYFTRARKRWAKERAAAIFWSLTWGRTSLVASIFIKVKECWSCCCCGCFLFLLVID